MVDVGGGGGVLEGGKLGMTGPSIADALFSSTAGKVAAVAAAVAAATSLGLLFRGGTGRLLCGA